MCCTCACIAHRRGGQQLLACFHSAAVDGSDEERALLHQTYGTIMRPSLTCCPCPSQDTGGFFVVVLRKVRELPAFELPTAYRPSQAEGAGGGGGEGRRDKPAINIEDPIAYAKDAAAAALAAAEAAIKALGEGDVGAVNRSNREASAAAGMAQAALDAQKQQQRKAAKTAAGQGPQQAAAAAACPGAAADAEAAAGEGMDLDGEDAGADAAMGGADDGDEAAAAAAAAAAKEESEDEGDAAGGPPKAGAGPSWVRGGGSRGRAEGGRHKHIDPVAPVEDPDILQVWCVVPGS